MSLIVLKGNVADIASKKRASLFFAFGEAGGGHLRDGGGAVHRARGAAARGRRWFVDPTGGESPLVSWTSWS